MDPNFKRSVIALCEHNEEGSIGFVLNKPLDIKLEDLLESFPEFDAGVYFGGPVATDTIHYIHNVGELLDGSVQICQGVHWGGDFEKLKFLVGSELVKPQNIRFYIGYSGWSPGQLKDEMELGSWVIDELDSNYVFKTYNEKLWGKVLNNKGNTFSVIAQMPKSSRLN